MAVVSGDPPHVLKKCLTRGWQPWTGHDQGTNSTPDTTVNKYCHPCPVSTQYRPNSSGDQGQGLRTQISVRQSRNTKQKSNSNPVDSHSGAGAEPEPYSLQGRACIGTATGCMVGIPQFQFQLN